MKKEEKKKGVSLIVLIITIIVVVILAGAIILNLTKNNPIENAKKASFLNDLDSFKNELSIYEASKSASTLGEFDKVKLQANDTSVIYDGQIDTSNTIKNIITGLNGTKYTNEFEVLNGELAYKGIDVKKQLWSQDVGIIVDNDKTNVVIATTGINSVKTGVNVEYKLRVYSNVGIKEIGDLNSNIVVTDTNGTNLATQPNITIGFVTNLTNEKQMTLTIDTNGLAEGEYKVKLIANSVENNSNLKNEETLSINSFIIDNTAPSVLSMIPSTAEWTNENVIVTIKYPIDAVKKEYSTDGTIWNDYTTDITVKTNLDIYARCNDAAENQSTQSTLTISNIDKVLPQEANISSISSFGNTINATVKLGDNESGLNISNSKYLLSNSSTPYSIDDVVWNTASGFTSNPQSISIPATQGSDYYLQVLSVDKAGNKLVSVSIRIISGVVEVGGIKYNKPDLSGLLSASTTAINWDVSNVESSILLSAANTDTSWYDYAAKKWANIKTSNNGNQAYWVWIPRYAYKITNSHTATAEQINIIFLGGKSNTQADGSDLPAGYTVHPAFSFGGTELSGIWVAKYEASSNTPNALESGIGYTGGGNNTALQVRVLPSVYSWRNISVGNEQTVSMNMTNSTGSVGTTTNVDTHQMKNIEWGAVAYLCQSQYGTEPWVNPYGDSTSGSYKLKTGYAGTSKNSGALAEGNASLSSFNTTNGVNASTTGNIYGVYDMSGGAFEMTASVINNGNSNIGKFGTSTYTVSNKIKPEYAKYYDIYTPGDEEKEGGAYYSTGGETLWNSGNAQSQNIIRKRLADATYAKFANKKGDALYETSSVNSYYGMYTSGTSGWTWLTSTLRDSSLGGQTSIGWNSDYMLVGHVYQSFFDRGGSLSNGSTSGLFSSGNCDGSANARYSFRPVLVLGSAL